MSASLAAPRRGAEIISIGPTATGEMGHLNIIVSDEDFAAEQAAQEPETPDLQFDRNLAEDMDDHALNYLAGTLLEQIEADIQSRAEWEDTANKAAKYLGVKLLEPETSVSTDGTVTKAIATCLLEANIKLWSTARAELLPNNGPVKVRRDDAQPPAPTPGQDWSKDQLALAFETDFNHFLTVTDREYYPDYSKMLMGRALIGNAFRKVYRCPLKRRPTSVWVKAQDLIVSNDCSHLSGAGRVTERIRYRQATMKRLQAMGHYRNVPLARPTGRTTETELATADIEGIAASPMLPEDFEHLTYECYCEVGSGTYSSLIGDLSRLDRDETGKRPGYPLPYRVTMDEDSRTILEIRRNWKQGDQYHEKRRRYVKYGFIPGLGFYDYGLIHIAGNPTQVATMISRAATDNAMFNNFPGWLQLSGPSSRNDSTVLRPMPGEVVKIHAPGAQDISRVVMPIPYKPLTQESLALIEKKEADVSRLAGVIEIPVGEGRIGNVPVGTIMAYIESIAQVPGAVHKDDHISQQDEYEMLRELFAEEPEILWRGNKSPARKWQVAQEILDPDLTPAADPNTPSQVHRIAKVQAAVALGGLPQFNMPEPIANNRAIYRKSMELLFGGDAQEYEVPPPKPGSQPPPPPDPRIIAAQIKAQSEQEKGQLQQQTEAMKHDERVSELAQEGIQRDADRQSAETRAALSLEGDRVKATHDTVNAGLDRAQKDAHHADDVATTQQQFTNPFGESGGMT